MSAAVARVNSFVFSCSDLAFRRNAAVTGAWIAITAAVLGALFAASGITHETIMLHDVVGYADGAYRIATGQIPHVDFHTPIGALNYYIIYLAYSITGDFGSAMPLSSFISLLILMPPILYVLPRHFSVFTAVLVGTYLILLVLAPMNVGELPSSITFAMFYNRSCWAALIIFFMYLSVYDPTERRTAIFDGIFFAFIVSFCFYTKITYAVVVIACLGLLCLLRPAARAAIAGGLALAVVIALAVEAATSLHGPYFADLAQTLMVSSTIKGGLMSGLLKPALKNTTEIFLVVLAVFIAVYEGLIGQRELVFALVVGGSSLAISNQNYQTHHLPAFIAVLALLIERSAAAAPTPGRRRLTFEALFAGILLAFIAQPMVNRAVALDRHFYAAARHQAEQGTPPALVNFDVEDLVGETVRGMWLNKDYDTLRHISPPALSLYQKEYFDSILNGDKILMTQNYQHNTVVVFDHSNPFNFTLSLTPVRGEAVINSFHRTFDTTWFTPPKELLSNADLVLVPIRAVTPLARDAMVQIYLPWLKAHYRKLGENKYWIMWGREPKRIAEHARRDRPGAAGGEHHRGPQASFDGRSPAHDVVVPVEKNLRIQVPDRG